MMLRAWVAVIALLACGAAAAASFSIALLGDTPYSQDEEVRFMEMLRDAELHARRSVRQPERKLGAATRRGKRRKYPVRRSAGTPLAVTN